MVTVDVTFSGGLEVVFGGKRKLRCVLDGEHTIRALIAALVEREEYDGARGDIFLYPGRSEPTLRPGILVFVNDVDWELLGGAQAVLSENDEVLFLSMLHGG